MIPLVPQTSYHLSMTLSLSLATHKFACVSTDRKRGMTTYAFM